MRNLPVMLLLLALVGCAAPSPQDGGTQATTPAPAAQADADTPAAASPRPGQPATPRTISDPRRAPSPTRAPVQIDRSCSVDSDCVVKDVGSCCGHAPACVNKGSPTDPAGVQAQCARNGMTAVCGFNEITACRCVRNECIGEQEPVGGWMDDPPAPPPADR